MILKEQNNHHHHQTNRATHSNEIGIWGMGCTAMQHLYDFICESNPKNKIGYYDVKHIEEPLKNSTSLNFNNVTLQLQQNIESYHINQFFNAADLVIVNGNHHHANNMLLILDGKKAFKPNAEHILKTSTIFYNEQTAALANELAAENNQIKLILGSDFETINQFIQKHIQQNEASIIGLILTGGESTRMKQNKSLIVYHEEAQWLHLYHLLQSKCAETFISCTKKNAQLFQEKPIITDTLTGYGPLSGILSALLKFKNKAILVLACDLPLLNEETINQLINERDPTKMATTFLNPDSTFLEPLITIYEPKALQIMLSMLAQGYTCPRKMLMQNEVKILNPLAAHTLQNINHPKERDQLLETLKKTEKL